MSVGRVVRSLFGEAWLDRARRARLHLRSLRPTGFRQSAYGVKLVGDNSDETYRFALKGAYGGFVRDQILALPKNAILLDIGANIGLYSSIGAQHLTGGKVYSFEPNPQVYCHLVKNLHKNGDGRATAFNVAISDQPAGLAILSTPEGHSGAASLNGFGNGVTVPVLGADFLNALYEPHRTYAAKIDVEGHELAVLSALAKSQIFLALHLIVLEISEPTQGEDGVRAITDFLSRHQFARTGASDNAPHRDEAWSLVLSKSQYNQR